MFEPGRTSATMEEADGLSRDIADLFQTSSITIDRPETGHGGGNRGTDKSAEAPPIAYTEYRNEISRFLEKNPEFNALFVSSDEQRFVDRVTRDFGASLSVVYHDDLEPSHGEIPVHRSKVGDPYRKAEEAIVNCLLLAECDALIKNASYLSAWSKLFNPELRVIFLNPPFADQLWFPERELLDHSVTIQTG